MGLNLYVTNKRTGTDLEMTWLRNPYGLCPWAQANYRFVTGSEPKKDLWYVLNHWNYSKGRHINKPLFLETVQTYAEVIRSLSLGYFWFDVSSFLTFVLPHWSLFPRETSLSDRVAGGKFHGQEYGIPMDYFGHPSFDLGKKYRLLDYQAWFEQLVQMAEALQEPGASFRCSN